MTANIHCIRKKKKKRDEEMTHSNNDARVQSKHLVVKHKVKKNPLEKLTAPLGGIVFC